jgi:hypothetical protein
MASHYTLTSFLRQASNALLAEYFRTRGIDPGIDFKALKQRQIEPVAEAIDGLPDDEQTAINSDFQKVVALADSAGHLQVVHEAKFRGIDLVAGFEAQKSILNRVFWTFLNHPDVFDGAAQFAAPYLAGRYWKRGLPVEGAPPGDPAVRIAALEKAVSAHFRSEEGRGKACKVEYCKRGTIHHFHAYPEDYPAAPLTWSRFGLAPLSSRD